MHPRLSVNQRSSPTWSLDTDLDYYERIGITAIGIDLTKVTSSGVDPSGPDNSEVDIDDAAIEKIRDRLKSSGMRIASLRIPSPFDLANPDGWPSQREQASRIMDIALALQPEVMTVTTGSPTILPWERAADSFEEVMHQILMEARNEGLRVAIEHNDPLLVDTGFIHTLRDAIDLSWRIDTGVCMVIDSCWSERNLAGTIAAGVEQISLVRVADRAIGNHLAGTSLVPGDGDIPLGRIIGQLLDAGYSGYFDILVCGPEIEQEGYESAIERSLRHLTDILGDQDAPDSDD